MALLGDMQAVGVRKMILTETSLRCVEAFPQKDDPHNRVFEDAKLSTCIFVTSRSDKKARFRSRVHPGKDILPDSPSLMLSPKEAKLYDPNNQPILACSQEDWNIATKLMEIGRSVRLGDYCTAFQGEVNETTDGKRGHISDDANSGPQILRGSNICLYVLREASQGEAMYLLKDTYLSEKREGAKAWHHLHRRVGLQESCPQNNFRRVIASLVPKDEFCNHKINYFPESQSRLPLEVLLGLLNSKLTDWYFRLGSTNASVSHYQLYNLPAPAFKMEDSVDRSLVSKFAAAVDGADWEAAFFVIESSLEEAPFARVVIEALVHIVRRISSIEAARGDIVRTERSSLAPEAQPLQDLLDRMLYRIAGLTDDDIAGLEERLVRML